VGSADELPPELEAQAKGAGVEFGEVSREWLTRQAFGFALRGIRTALVFAGNDPAVDSRWELRRFSDGFVCAACWMECTKLADGRDEWALMAEVYI
jgi:hypothetical protein